MEATLTTKAKLAEQTERYNDMSKFMKELVDINPKLEEEGRNLLSVAFKNVVGSKRSAWRIINAALAKEEGARKDTAQEYLNTIEEELVTVCTEILALLDKQLIPSNEEKESQVFYYKMKGDYYRYISEVKESKEESVKGAREAYEKAQQKSEELPSTHPIRLGLALNMSVFFYEIINDEKKACELAKAAFDGAIAELDSLKEDSYKDSTLIMQLLRDNLTLWTSERDDNEGPEDQ